MKSAVYAGTFDPVTMGHLEAELSCSLSEVSSSRLKQLALAGADLSPYCPELVATRLRERLAPGKARHA